jgi:hypothetical protein
MIRTYVATEKDIAGYPSEIGRTSREFNLFKARGVSRFSRGRIYGVGGFFRRLVRERHDCS